MYSELGLNMRTSIPDPTMDWEICPHTKPIPNITITYNFVTPGCMNQLDGETQQM